MINIYLWGAGINAEYILYNIEKCASGYKNNTIFKINGIIDSDLEKNGKEMYGYRIFLPEDVCSKDYDAIVITTIQYESVRQQAIMQHHVNENKIKPAYFLMKLLLLYKYENTEDKEIQQTLAYLKTNDLSMYNNFLVEQSTKQYVKWDKLNNMPYVEFEDCEHIMRRMYYPREYVFEIENGRQVVDNLLYEQHENSPHVYCFGKHIVNRGDVVVDGGVCEGNFALKYATIASKFYLFEPDRQWEEAHYYTFRDFKEKIYYSYKYLGADNNNNVVSLDSLLGKQIINFLKLDIEGGERDALEGAKTLIKYNNVKASVCSYHRKNDAETIIKYFDECGYQTSTSNGVVAFIWGEDVWESLDFRKCMVYAEKRI